MAVHLTDVTECAILITDIDRDVLIYTRIALPLPQVIDDLLLPDNIISSHPVACTDTPSWKTTMVYFLSYKMLRHLRLKDTLVKLEVSYLTTHGITERVGTFTLSIHKAKQVKLSDRNVELQQVGTSVEHTGEWYSVRKEGEEAIKVGLFIVNLIRAKMEDCDTMDQVMPMSISRSSHRESGLSGRVQRHIPGLSTTTTTTNTNTAAEYLKHQLLSECSVLYHQIGTVKQSYSFNFTILEAKHLTSLFHSANIQCQYPHQKLHFQYNFLGQRTLQTIVIPPYPKDTWTVLQHQHQQRWCMSGHLPHILEWMNLHRTFHVYLILLDEKQKHRRTIGQAKVCLSRLHSQQPERQAFLVYNYGHPHDLCMSATQQFVQIAVRSGISQGWG
ncbi:hypothetical protein BDF14DRAFT_1869826 [Spinellus fusiger]|nr:hypothetical protein BDF14DRAFT_1869826 [Spinellus fusiger]